MPLAYGGGVTTHEQIERIIGLGVEKVSISASAVSASALISVASELIGCQSIVVVIDVKKTGVFRRYEVVTHNGTRRTGLDPINFAQELQNLGAGEIILNSVDLDGEMKGYDLELISKVAKNIRVPVTALGWAGSLDDVASLWETQGMIAAAAGSLFVFKGKYKAVLINYPNEREKLATLTKAGWQE